MIFRIFWVWGEENNYKLVRVSNFWSNNYIEYKSNSDRNKAISVEECINKSRPYLKDIINNLKKFDAWKIQLTIRNIFISSIDNDEERVMHSKSDNTETIISNKADEAIKELFDSIKIDIKIIWNQRKVVILSLIMVSYCIINAIKNLNSSGSYIDCPVWVKNKKATRNLINKQDKKCFQWAVTVALNHEKTKKGPQRITKIKHFLNKYNWEGIHFLSEKVDRKNLRKII